MLDVNSGAVHLLDEPAFALVKQIISYQGDVNQAMERLAPAYTPALLNEIWDELVLLHAEGALFTDPVAVRVDLEDAPVKALCLNVAHACNMKCRYCFAGQGDFGLQPSLMSLEIARLAVDFLVANSKGRRQLEVDFFGGEPLLVADMLKELVQYCRMLEQTHDKKFAFTLTTNTLLLDNNIADWLVANQIGIIMSLDGRPEVNDRHRPLATGQGSYAIIVPKIQDMIARQPDSYYVRGTFSRENPDFASDLDHLVQLGFHSVSLEPAVGPDNGYAIQPSDLPQVLQEYERLTDLLADYADQDLPVQFYHYNLDLQKGPCISKRVTGCGAGLEYLAITPEGDIYPCHQLVGESGFCMGNVRAGTWRQELRSVFASSQLEDKDCKRCWARYFCGGGCHAQAILRNGDIKIPYESSCIMHRKRIEGAIYLDSRRRIRKN